MIINISDFHYFLSTKWLWSRKQWEGLLVFFSIFVNKIYCSSGFFKFYSTYSKHTSGQIHKITVKYMQSLCFCYMAYSHPYYKGSFYWGTGRSFTRTLESDRYSQRGLPQRDLPPSSFQVMSVIQYTYNKYLLIKLICGKFLKRWEYQTTWPASWEICRQVRKQQLELDMEQQTGSKSGKEYVKAVYCHPAYLTSMQSTSWEMLGWVKHKLESRSPGEISITSDMQITPPIWQKAKRN